jgi:AcrR family transcriptional regulator
MTEHVRRKSKTKLGPADWISATLETIAEEGPSGFRVARLARRLGVTSPSFYWHFRDRDELRDRALRHWVGPMLRNAAAGARSPSNLLDILVDRNLPGLDAAMRRWATEDPVVAEAVRKADVLRHRVVTKLFEAEGLEAARAARCADLLGWAFRGSNDASTKRRAQGLRELINSLTGSAK